MVYGDRAVGGDELMRELIPLSGISVLVTGIPRALLSLPPCKDRVKGGQLWPRQWDFIRLNMLEFLILGFPASWTVRNKCMILKPPSLWCFCYSGPPRKEHSKKKKKKTSKTHVWRQVIQMVKRLKTKFHEDVPLRKIKIQVGRRAVLEWRAGVCIVPHLNVSKS